MADDLVAFLRARLDEDEQLARAATAGPWWYNPGKMWLGEEAFVAYDRSQGEEFVGYGGPPPFAGCVAATGPADHRQSMADADHIARWHPARVLAEVDAKRRIIEEHDTQGWKIGDRVHDCQWESWPCRTLRLLALPYRDHPDYQSEWTP